MCSLSRLGQLCQLSGEGDVIVCLVLFLSCSLGHYSPLTCTLCLLSFGEAFRKWVYQWLFKDPNKHHLVPFHGYLANTQRSKITYMGKH